MNRRIVALIMILVTISFLRTAYASEEIRQETRGDQSPAIYAPGGEVNLTFVHNEVRQINKETSEQFLNCLDLAIEFQQRKLQDLNKTLAQLYVQKIGASKQEATKWAQEIIEKAPEYRKQQEAIKKQRLKYNEELSKNIMANVYKLFTYTFQTIDAKLLAFRKLAPEVQYEIKEEFALFMDQSTRIDPYVARIAILPNGSTIRVSCQPGALQNGLVSTCPILRFIEIFQQKAVQSFALEPHYGGGTITCLGPRVQLRKKEPLNNVNYSATGDPILNEALKKTFDETFDEFFKLAYTR